MLNVPVYNTTGEKVGEEALDEALLGGELNAALLKQAVVMYHANQRQGTVQTKSRADVDGSSRKLFRQKGTGRARRELRDVPPFEIFPIAVSPFERVSVSPNTILGHLYYRNFERNLRAHGLMFATPESQKHLRETMRSGAGTDLRGHVAVIEVPGAGQPVRRADRSHDLERRWPVPHQRAR